MKSNISIRIIDEPNNLTTMNTVIKDNSNHNKNNIKNKKTKKTKNKSFYVCLGVIVLITLYYSFKICKNIII